MMFSILITRRYYNKSQSLKLFSAKLLTFNDSKF